jgi:predicted Fe-S protein YdhL (DUF1289 family)
VDREAEERQQTKGDEMTLGDFMEVLGRLHKLTPAQRRAVAEVLAEPEEVQRSAEASEPVAKRAKRAARKAYSVIDRNVFKVHAARWNRYSKAQKDEVIKTLIELFNHDRSAAALQRQIDYYRNGK